MNYDTTYNPAHRLTRWQRFQVWVYDRYGVDAGKMIGAMASGFVGAVLLGIMVVVQL